MSRFGDFGHHQNKYLLEIILYPQELGDVVLVQLGHQSQPLYDYNHNPYLEDHPT